MSYTIIYTKTIGIDDVYYSDTSEQAADDARFLDDFRINSPGYLGGTAFEPISPTSDRITFVFDTLESYNNYKAAIIQTPQWQRRQAYYDSILYIPDTEIIHSVESDDPTGSTGSSIES